MNKTVLSLVLISLLGGCTSSETASYMVNGAETAVTLLRAKAYPWDDFYMRSVVVTSRPKCITRYKMPPDDGDMGKVEVYDAGEGYFVLKDKFGQYMTNLADCSMFLVDKKIEDPGELKGNFETSEEQPLHFVPVPAKPKPKAPLEGASDPAAVAAPNLEQVKP